MTQVSAVPPGAEQPQDHDTPEASSYSGYWRIRRSSSLPMELVRLMEDMSDVAREFTKGQVDSVSWTDHEVAIGGGVGVGAARTEYQGSRIRVKLDARPIFDQAAPLPHERVDVILGQMLHEVGHTRWESRRVWQLMQPVLGELGDLTEVAQYFQNVLDDFYIDRRWAAESPSAGTYVQAMRRWYDVPGASQSYVPRLHDPNMSDNERLKSLLQIVMGMSVYKQPAPTGMLPDDIQVIIGIMEILNKVPVKASPQVRHRLYAEAWAKFKAHPKPRPVEQPKRPEPSQDQPPQDQKPGQCAGGDGPPKPQADEKTPDDQEKPEPETGGKGDNEPEDEQPEPEDDELPDDPEAGDDAPEPDDDQEEADGQEPENDPDPEGDEPEPTNTDGDGDEGDFDEAPEPEAYDDTPVAEAPPALPWDVGDDEQGLPKKLADQVNEFLRTHAEDLEAAMREILGAKVEGTSHIMRDADGPGSTQHDAIAADIEKLAEPYGDRIGRLFNQIRDSNFRSLRGIKAGRVSQRRLWRGGMARTDLFERREKMTANGLSLIVLLDQSSSMSGTYESILLPVATAIVKGCNPDIEVTVASYTGLHNTEVKVLSRPQWGKTIRYGFGPMNNTPSGAGMVAADELLKTARFQRRMVLHVTDGAPGNVGHVDGFEAVQKAREAMNAKGILTATLMVGMIDTAVGIPPHLRPYLAKVEKAYGTLRHVGKMDQVPDAIEQLLQEVLQG